MKFMLSVPRLIAQFVIMAVFSLALSSLAGFLICMAVGLKKQEKIQLAGAKIEEISKQEFWMPGGNPRKETISIVRLNMNDHSDSTIAVLYLDVKSAVIVRSPNEDAIIRKTLGLTYPIYIAYDSLFIHMIVIYGSVSILITIVAILLYHSIGTVKAIRKRKSEPTGQP